MQIGRVSPLHPTRRWGASWAPSGSGAKKTIWVQFNLRSSPLLTADDSKYFTCVLKSGGTVPPDQKNRYPLYPRMPMDTTHAEWLCSCGGDLFAKWSLPFLLLPSFSSLPFPLHPFSLADPGFSFGGRYRGFAGAEGVGFGEKVSLSPMGRDLGKIFGFLPLNDAFCVYSDTLWDSSQRRTPVL